LKSCCDESTLNGQSCTWLDGKIWCKIMCLCSVQSVLTNSWLRTAYPSSFKHRIPRILFPHLKSFMKNANITDVSTTNVRVVAVLRSVITEAFANSFHMLYGRCQKLIKTNWCFLILITEICLYFVYCLFYDTITETFRPNSYTVL
jgi:hypothetical protein